MKADAINLGTFSEPTVVYGYSQRTTLQGAEEKALKLLAPEFRNKVILDLGVGAGRTTPFLLSLSSNYRAIDYSPGMVEVCRKRFPGVEVSVGDARDLTRFCDGSIDLAVFSFNGIDYVSHVDRLKILREVFRVLRPSGLFCFSSSNRNGNPMVPGWHPKTLGFREYPTINPLRVGHRLFRYAVRARNSLRYRRLEEITDEYAIINGPWHEYRLLQYHITPEKQVRQLRGVGFSSVIVVSEHGVVEESLWPTFQSSIYYLTRKSEASLVGGDSRCG